MPLYKIKLNYIKQIKNRNNYILITYSDNNV